MRTNSVIKIATGLSVVAAATVLGLSGCGGSASGDNSKSIATLASANGSTDLSGTWTLNKDLSDHPRRPDGVRGPGPGNHPDSLGGPGGGWRRHGGRGDHGSRPDSLRGEHRMRWAHGDSARGDHPMRGPMTFTIAQTDSTVAITGPRGRTRTLYTDGRVITHADSTEEEHGQVTTSWNAEGHLVVEGTGPRGGKRTETYALSLDSKQLIIDTHLDPAGNRGSMDFRRVFDAGSTN